MRRFYRVCFILGLTFGLAGFAHAQTDPAQADFDGNGTVEFADFLQFVALFGKTSADPEFDSRMDFDGNGTIDFPDFLQFVSVFGQSSGITPAAPTPTLAVESNMSIAVSWAAIANATGYNVERRMQGLSDFTTVAENVTGTSYTDTGLVPGTDYDYRIVVISAAGPSKPGSVAMAMTTPSGMASGMPEVLTGLITSDRLLTSDKYYLLSGAVFIQDGATLTIEPGTQIFGEGATNGTLIVAQGGKVIANGRADRPIVFTSDALDNEKDRGQWGGLIINGRAPVNTGAIAQGEGDTGTYGGSDPTDNSGVLRYVRVEFAGIEFSPDNELNGIAFQGVGSGTVVDYVQVHFNQDDGIEFFGGTVNAKHLYCTGIRDDSFDWTDGWTGKGQFWVAQQRGDDADNGFESDNEGDNNEAMPRSNPTIYNVTLVGDPNGPESDTGLLLREGTAATLRNFIVIGFNKGGLDIDTGSSIQLANSGELSVQNTIFYNNKVDGTPGNFEVDDDEIDEAVWARMPAFNNSEVDPMLMAPYSLGSPDYRPGAGSPALTMQAASPPDDGFFESVSYIGAFDAANNWLAGWSTSEQPAGTVLPPAAPSGVIASGSGTSIQVTWNASEGATSYTVQRRMQGLSTFEEVSTGPSTSFSDMGLVPGTEYDYRIIASSDVGSSSASAIATGMTTSSGMASGMPEVLTGRITSDRLLTSDKYYLLSGAVFVQDGATLTIEPGTTLFGEGATNGTLIVAQGGKVIANGRADRPIVFTSDAVEGQRDRGQWGGLIINGRAPVNTGAIAQGEGDTGTYGGSDPTDNSGVLRYVRVEFAGIEFSPDNELNGIAFQGVGSGTVVDYVQVHFNQDDGIEFFGGTVNAKHLYCTGIRDDSFDWTDGWTGKGQFWVAQQRGDDADNGFESDNEGDNNEAMPRSNPTIYNVTLVGDPNGPESDTGLLLREGTAATLRNFIVIGFNKGGLDIDTGSSIQLANSGELSVQNTIFYNNKVDGTPGNFEVDDDEIDEAAWATMASFNNAEVDPMLMAPYSLRSPDYRPFSSSPAVTMEAASPPSDGFFDAVSYIGGVGPNNNWLAGWTTAEQPAGAEEIGSIEILEGRITSDRTLTSDKSYLLKGAVFVDNSATLTIEPGTFIFGEGATNGTLIVAQGGKLMADGTASRPIVFTSDAVEGQRDRGQWGGLIINGRAPVNTGAIAQGEGDTGTYGGSDPTDNSGVLRYVRVEFAGIEFSPDNELNGIAFQGVGSGTVVDYVQVHFNQDDGIEFFGGTVNAKHLYCTGIRDDSFDWTDGWTGKGQFWVAQQRGDDADNGFESDNEGDNNEAMPRSNPTIYNVTLVGDPNGPESDTGLLLREGTAATLRNFIVIGFNKGGLDIDTGSSIQLANSGELSVQNTIFYNNKVDGTPGNFEVDNDGEEGTPDSFDEASWARMPAFNNAEVNPMLMAPYSTSTPDFTPESNSPAVDGTVPVASPPDDGFFTSVNFIGGVDPLRNWLAGWTTNERPAGQ